MAPKAKKNNSSNSIPPPVQEQIDAVSRDYILEPRLGKGVACSLACTPLYLSAVLFPAEMVFRLHLEKRSGGRSWPDTVEICELFDVYWGHGRGFLADYRTVGGVSGPLVIVESVKVRCEKENEIQMWESFSCLKLVPWFSRQPQ
jgi:hypothetical protein